MKILKIKIKNINCLRCEWEINFQKPPLSSAGLFAITGATGSGKSTILDAITLALFNKIPRFESETISNTFVEKAGSILTKNETDCFVEVDYSCPKGVYRSKWTIATNKRGNLRANDMELIDVTTNKIEAQGKRDVPAKNTELIGLTYDQFIKSILLAQGEFAKFLKSKKDERGKLLEDITGMTVYRELGRRAFEKFKEKNEAIKTRIEIIDSEESQLLSQESEDELEQLIVTLNKELQDEESQHATIEKAIEIKDQIRSIENEIEKHSKDEEQVNRNLEQFNRQNEQRILKHERLLPHLNELRNYFNTYNSVKTLSEEVKRHKTELETKTKQVGITLSEICQLTGTKVEMQNAEEILTKFRDRVIYLTTKKLDAEELLNKQKQRLANYLKNASLVAYRIHSSGNKIEDLKSKVCKELSIIASKTNELIRETNIKVENISEQKDLLSVRLKLMEDLKLQVQNYKDNQTKWKNKERQVNDESELISSETPTLQEIKSLKNAVASKINEVEKKREAKLREEQLEEQRKKLKQSEPCPLCGSLYHPYIHEYINTISDLTKEMQKLEDEEKKYEKEIQDLEKQIHTHSGMLNALKEDMKLIEKEMMEQKNKIEIRKQQLKIEKVGNVQAIEAAITDLDKSVKAMNDFEKMVVAKRNLEDLKEVIDELVCRLSEFERAKSEVEARYKGTSIREDCNELSRQLNVYENAIQESKTKIESNKTQLEELANRQTKIESLLSNKLHTFGYENILSSSADILLDTEFNNLKQHLSDLQGNVKKIQALVHNANERKQRLVATDDSNISKEDLLQELKTIAEHIEQQQQKLDESRAQKMQNETRKNRIVKLKEQVEETRQANLKWELLCKYIGDAQGKNFSTFAQSLTLKKLIILTNERLKKLNDRYLLDIPLDEEDDDLVIIDTYLADERRSVKTLSGGETFIVSLALALALSDLASQNVKIESLYIDEGFGSLDPDALETAISTLEQLQMESNKTIGIISHIESLKERIETQIQLEKNGSGFSKIIIK